MYEAYGVSVKDGERYVDILAPLVDTSTGDYLGKLHLAIPETTGRVFCGWL